MSAQNLASRNAAVITDDAVGALIGLDETLEMSWPRRHELIDVDLDAYADDDDAQVSDNAQASDRQSEAAPEQERVSALEAAERAGIPLEELLRGLSW